MAAGGPERTVTQPGGDTERDGRCELEAAEFIRAGQLLAQAEQSAWVHTLKPRKLQKLLMGRVVVARLQSANQPTS